VKCSGCWQFMQTHMEVKDKKYQSTSKRKFDLEREHEVGDCGPFCISLSATTAKEHKSEVSCCCCWCLWLREQEMMKKLDIDNYTLSRIPRPPGADDTPKDK